MKVSGFEFGVVQWDVEGIVGLPAQESGDAILENPI